MCTTSVLEFFIEETSFADFDGKRILELGSRYVNGSIRPYILKTSKPLSYIGIDVEDGKFVDQIVRAEDIVKVFGEESFDVLISTEMVEHVQDWRLVFEKMKGVLKKGGLILLTTRSKGFPLHNYPADYWRYEVDDMQEIFSDFVDLKVVPDTVFIGVCVRARKPADWAPNDLSRIELYSMEQERIELEKETALKEKYQRITIWMDPRHFRILKFLYRTVLGRSKTEPRYEQVIL